MVEVVAGRRYRVVHEASGEAEEGPAYPVPRSTTGTLSIARWRISPDGEVIGIQGYRVEAVEPDAASPHELETTEARHAADEQDMSHDGLPRMHKKR